MNEKKLYKVFFNIDPKYYSAVTSDLIKSGEVKWNGFYPHDSFIKLLEKTQLMLSRIDGRSLWVEGAYGTGKSHAVLTLKSLLEANAEDVRNYFNDYQLDSDFCETFISDRGDNILVAFAESSSSIRSDRDLIIEIQTRIVNAMKERNIVEYGEDALRDAAIKWLSKKANADYFQTLINEEQYIWSFGGRSVNDILEILQNGSIEEITTIMRSISTVAKDNGITALDIDIVTLCNWLQNIIKKNSLSAIVFIWDEFTEFFQNNPMGLSGFQTLLHLSSSFPIYFLIVTHLSRGLLDNDERNKLLGRFVGSEPILIELPDNMAFQLMGQAMRPTSDPVLLDEWNTAKKGLNDTLGDVRKRIMEGGSKNVAYNVTNEQLCSVIPIHPYAALLLKHMSEVFSANARSMFDFIINNDLKESKGFKWFIENNSPYNDENALLTVDLLYDFFISKKSGIEDNAKQILESYDSVKIEKLNSEQKRVFKTTILLEAISTRVHNVDLLLPTRENIDLSFRGIDWPAGKASGIVEGLKEQGYLFEKKIGDIVTYTTATIDVIDLDKTKKECLEKLKTKHLIDSGNMISIIDIPKPVKARYSVTGCSEECLPKTLTCQPNHFKVVITFALDNKEAQKVHENISKLVVQPINELIFVECKAVMGKKLLDDYIENLAYNKYYQKNDHAKALGYEELAKNCIRTWMTKIEAEGFNFYSPNNPNGKFVANKTILAEELLAYVKNAYAYGLEHYDVADTMFEKNYIALGAECGILQNLKNTYSGTVKKLDKALEGAWLIPEYWRDSKKQSLAIVHIKKKLEEIIQQGFKEDSGRVCVYDIFTALQEKPYGFLPCNLASFIFGFLLKEYAVPEYFWSDGANSEPMSPVRMKKTINNAISQIDKPNAKFKKEYIVLMSPGQRTFLNSTSKIFDIQDDQCGSVENATVAIRTKMTEFPFPIWCLKEILGEKNFESPIEVIEKAIDSYCAIANKANGENESESASAEQIGKLASEYPHLVDELKELFSNDNINHAMDLYIQNFQGGLLIKLANEIEDQGGYLERLHTLFAPDANWVWNIKTANEKIAEVILEYQIIEESNKSIPHCRSIENVISEWNKRAENIKIPYDVLANNIGDLKDFLHLLYQMKKTEKLEGGDKAAFYQQLLESRESFETFYNNQVLIFKKVAKSFLINVQDDEVTDFYSKLSNGQFLLKSSDYFKGIEKSLKEYLDGLAKNHLKKLWLEKTNTKDPREWSTSHLTPILAMFEDTERAEASQAFETLSSYGAKDSDVQTAIEYLEKGEFFERLKDATERDRCFMKHVVADWGILLTDIEDIRMQLKNNVNAHVYDWIGKGYLEVHNVLKQLADKEYKVSGLARVEALIGKMGQEDLHKYFMELIRDNMNVGIEILKGAEDELQEL